MKLSRVGEDRLLAALLASLRVAKSVVVSAGDDCAVVKIRASGDFLVLKTDCVVEQVHFSSSAKPTDIGWKAMMRPLSDFAATSALPQFALVTLIVSRATEAEWVKKIYRGLSRAAARFGVSIVGGETSSTPGPVTISIGVAGCVEKNRFVSRRGAKAGDDLFVTGRLGGALRHRHLQFVPRIPESRWLTENFSIHAMIDLSDGLGTDLPRLARASKVGFNIDMQNLPLSSGCNIDSALSDGEDYELLFAVSPRARKRLQERWRKKFPKLPLTRIGSLNRQSAVGNRQLLGGYVHFQ
ncbi:MAG TPA: thiamine-phosphate kinase [Chthoniobacterales bacterium]|nr:thiamine-phosphate kinase [Chthoniobacterales bacterium]